MSEDRNTVPFFSRQLDISSVCHTYHEELSWRHFCETEFHSLLHELVDRRHGLFLSLNGEGCATLCGASGIWFTRQAQVSQLIELVSLPLKHTQHTSTCLLPAPPTASTHQAHGSCTRPWQKSDAATAVLPHSWHRPGADYGEFSILLLILLFHSHETQTASNTLPHLVLMSYRSWVLLSENPASFFVCPFEKLKCSQSLETNFRVNCIWTFKILPLSPLG